MTKQTVLDRLAFSLLHHVALIRQDSEVQNAVDYNGLDRDGVIISVLDGFLKGEFSSDGLETVADEIQAAGWRSGFRCVKLHLFVIAGIYREAAAQFNGASDA